MVARGEIWWHEAAGEKRRPYLVLTRDEAIPVLNQVLAVPATTVVRDIPTEVMLGTDDGMPVQCVLTLDNVRCVRTAYLVERITKLDDHQMTQVCERLAFAVRC